MRINNTAFCARALQSAATIAIALSVNAVAPFSGSTAQAQGRDTEGAGQQPRQRAAQQSASIRTPLPGVEREMSDQRLEDWIIVRLADRASYTPGIDVKVSDGDVTLMGKVPSEEIRRRAMRVAITTPGVTTVTDELRVDASTTKAQRLLDGPELERQVAMRIASNIEGAKAGEDWWFTGWRVEGPFNTWNMTVEADEPGRVVLEGDVPKWEIMRKAVEAAANTPGVRVVDSELEYEPNYYPIYRYGEERYHGYYPYYPYISGPPYAAPLEPGRTGRAVRPAPPVPGDAADAGRGSEQRR